MASVWEVYPDEDEAPAAAEGGAKRRRRSTAGGDDDRDVTASAGIGRARLAGDFVLNGEVASTVPKLASEADLDELASDLPSDTLATVLLLRNRFPKALPVCPIVIKSHIYSIVSDRTAVDRQLEQLNRNNKVQIVKLASGRVDYGVLVWEDYCSVVSALKEGKGEDKQRLLDWFLDRVVSQTTHCYVSDYELESHVRSFLSSDSSAESDEEARDNCVAFLVQSGLLRRKLSVHGGYLFSVPNAGIFVKKLCEGRKRLATMVKRRKRGEILQWDLEKMKLPKATTLGMTYQLRDAIGSGLFDQVETTCGPLLRLTHEKEKK